jgi:hypothetical protein
MPLLRPEAQLKSATVVAVTKKPGARQFERCLRSLSALYSIADLAVKAGTASRCRPAPDLGVAIGGSEQGDGVSPTSRVARSSAQFRLAPPRRPPSCRPKLCAIPQMLMDAIGTVAAIGLIRSGPRPMYTSLSDENSYTHCLAWLQFRGIGMRAAASLRELLCSHHRQGTVIPSQGRLGFSIGVG